MPLSDDNNENEICAECSLEAYPNKFRIYGPEGWESWSLLSDGTFVVTDDNGPSYQYIYPHCLCAEMIELELIPDDEQSLCYACKHLETEE